jgi:hypothetical protein
LGRNLLVVAPSAADIFLDGILDAAAREGWNLGRHVGPPSDIISGAQLTPHAIAGTREAVSAIRRTAIENVAAVFEGVPIRACNPEVRGAHLRPRSGHDVRSSITGAPTAQARC